MVAIQYLLVAGCTKERKSAKGFNHIFALLTFISLYLPKAVTQQQPALVICDCPSEDTSHHVEAQKTTRCSAMSKQP